MADYLEKYVVYQWVANQMAALARRDDCTASMLEKLGVKAVNMGLTLCETTGRRCDAGPDLQRMFDRLVQDAAEKTPEDLQAFLAEQSQRLLVHVHIFQKAALSVLKKELSKA